MVTIVRILFILVCLIVWNTSLHAQPRKSTEVVLPITTASKKVDSSLVSLNEISSKYFTQVDQKIDKYRDRISSKTEKTLVKLSRWEKKIKVLLVKASPETAEKLFGKNALTFSSMLDKARSGDRFIKSYESSYDAYRDKLSTNIKYVQSQKRLLDSGFNSKVMRTSSNINELEKDLSNSEQLQKVIKERKTQLINEAIKYVGNNKYLSKINKESYYYIETLRNYKEIFSDEKKAEKTAMTILNKI